LTREPRFDELIGAETSDAERERLLRAHELLLQAGPPPELPPQLRKAPGFGVKRLAQRRVVKRRAMVLLAATLSVAAVFAAGYAVAEHRGGSTHAALLSLKGTKAAPKASATLEVWQARGGNWPMTLSVVGLGKLPPHTYYEVYLVRNGRPWGQCGAFRITNPSQAVTLSFTAPYKLRQGDTWVVTRPGPGGSGPGKTVLRPVAA